MFDCTCRVLTEYEISHPIVYGDIDNKARRLSEDLCKVIDRMNKLEFKSYKCTTVVKSIKSAFIGININFVF